MRVALCFSGHLRDAEKSFPFWKEFIERYDVDVFASFWEDATAPQSDEPVKPENPSFFKKWFSPKAIEWENNRTFRETTLNLFREEILSPRNPEIPKGLSEEDAKYTETGMILSMWYKIWRANILCQAHGQYDIIVRARTDVYLKSPLVLDENPHLNLPVGLVFNRGWENCFGWVDLIFYGKPDVMNYTSSLFLYLTRYLKEGHYFAPTENVLRVHLAQKEMKINFFQSAVYLCRKDPNGPSINGGTWESKVDLLRWGFCLPEEDLVDGGLGEEVIRLGYNTEVPLDSSTPISRDKDLTFYRPRIPGKTEGRSFP